MWKFCSPLLVLFVSSSCTKAHNEDLVSGVKVTFSEPSGSTFTGSKNVQMCAVISGSVTDSMSGAIFYTTDDEEPSALSQSVALDFIDATTGDEGTLVCAATKLQVTKSLTLSALAKISFTSTQTQSGLFSSKDTTTTQEISSDIAKASYTVSTTAESSTDTSTDTSTSTDVTTQTDTTTSTTVSQATPTPAPAALSSVSPAYGPAAGGTTLTLSGSNFASGATVAIGGVSCTNVNVASATSLTCVTGAMSAGSENIVLTQSGQTSTLSSAFEAYSPVTISPATKTLAVNNTVTFSAAGGHGARTFSISSGSGSVDPSSGLYTAPASAGSATVRVEDAVGNFATAAVTVNAALEINVSSLGIIKGKTYSFSAANGVSPYTFSLSSGSGSVTSAGAYTAPGSTSSDVVRVTDSLGNTSDCAVSVVNAGDLDPTFGSSGTVQFSVTTGGAYPWGLSVLSDRSIQVSGHTDTTGSSSYDVFAAKITASGALDTSFGTSGKVTTNMGSSYDYAWGGLSLSDGSLIAVGDYTPGGYSKSVIYKYTSAGALDTAFNSTGYNVTDWGSAGSSKAAVVQGDGKIVVAGYRLSGGWYQYATARFNTDGTIDTNYGSSGKTSFDVTASANDMAYGIALQTDGKIVIVGATGNNIGVIRLTTAGALDTTFGTNGIASVNISGSTDSGRAIAIQQDGKIVVGATANGQFALLRFNTDGSLDTTFNSTGSVIAHADTGSDVSESIAISSSGAIYLGGWSTGSYTSPTVEKFDSTGALDSSFGSSGIKKIDFGAAANAYKIALDSAGGLIVSGYYNSNAVIMRLLVE